MKQAFVTVGHWTLRCDDVSGVSHGGSVVGLIVGGQEASVRFDSPEEAAATRRRVEDAIGFTDHRVARLMAKVRATLAPLKDADGPHIIQMDGLWGWRYLNQDTGKLFMVPGLDTTDTDPLVVALAAAKHAGVTE